MTVKRFRFSLIELLAVIIVLSIIVLITAVSVNKVLDNVDNKLSKTQIKNIESAAKMYYLEEGMNISDTYGCVSVNDLISKGYIENTEITDPKTSEKVFVIFSNINFYSLYFYLFFSSKVLLGNQVVQFLYLGYDTIRYKLAT